MKEKLFGRGRRGGVLIIAGAVLGAAVAGPGATIAQKAMNLTTTTGDKRYVKRSEVPATGAVVEAPLTNFKTATFTPIANAIIKAPGPGTLIVHGSLTAKDGPDAGDGKLQYRLAAGATPLSATPTSFELDLPDLATAGETRSGSVDGIAKVARKGPVDVQLQAQEVAPGTGSHILGRSVTAQFVPKAKVAGKKKGKKPSDGGGGGNVGP